MSLGRIVALLLIVFSAHAFAQVQSQGQVQQSQKPETPAPPPKQAPPLLFPKHHRGIYRNAQNLEVIDATPQSPPLDIDDPSVPDKGAYEINLTTHADLSRDAQRVDLLAVDANYGTALKIAGHEIPTQIKFEFPVAATREQGNPLTVGIGGALFGLKFNFYNNEQTGLSLSLYPQVHFVIPGTGGVEKDLAESGQTVTVPVLVSQELKYLTLVVNGAVNTRVHNPERNTTGTLGVGVGRAITSRCAAMAQVRAESAFDLARDRLVSVHLGLMGSVRQIVLYTQWGHSLVSEEGLSHTYVAFGLKMLVQPQEKK